MKKNNVVNHAESDFWKGVNDSYSWLKYLFIGLSTLAVFLNVFL